VDRIFRQPLYRGHNPQNPRRVFISGQKCGGFGVIKRELRLRSAIEPVIGHLKAEGHLGRCYLKSRASDAANVVLSAVGHNFRRILLAQTTLLPVPVPPMAQASLSSPAHSDLSTKPRAFRNSNCSIRQTYRSSLVFFRVLGRRPLVFETKLKPIVLHSLD